MAKGSNYEREMARQFSLWLSKGKDPDMLWRSQTSGGRATQRAKQGKNTEGQYGDLAAVKLAAIPFIEHTVVELKRGYNKATIHDLTDKPKNGAPQPWEQFLSQAILSMECAVAATYLIVHKRDRRQPVIAFESSHLPSGKYLPHIRYCGELERKMDGERWTELVDVAITNLDSFFQTFDPSEFSY